MTAPANDRIPPAALAMWALAASTFLYAFLQRVSPSVMVEDLMAGFGVGGTLLGNLSAFYLYAYAAPGATPAALVRPVADVRFAADDGRAFTMRFDLRHRTAHASSGRFVEIDAAGLKFDPHRHQAMAMIGKNCSSGRINMKQPPSQRHLPRATRLGRKFLPLMVVNLWVWLVMR